MIELLIVLVLLPIAMVSLFCLVFGLGLFSIVSIGAFRNRYDRGDLLAVLLIGLLVLAIKVINDIY